MLKLVVLAVIGFGGLYFISTTSGNLFSPTFLKVSSTDARAEYAAAHSMTHYTLSSNIFARPDTAKLRLRFAAHIGLLEHNGQSTGPISHRETFYLNYNGIGLVTQNIQLRGVTWRGEQLGNTNSRIVPNSCVSETAHTEANFVAIKPTTCLVRADRNDELTAVVGVFVPRDNGDTSGSSGHEFCLEKVEMWFVSSDKEGAEIAICVLVKAVRREREVFGYSGVAANAFVFHRAPDNTIVQILK